MSTAEEVLQVTRETAQAAIDRIPPDAWPMIDIAFRITIGLAIIWFVLSIIGWWRRRAYNLTIASTAKRNKKAQPDFLKVDEKARAKAIDRGKAHEEMLDQREAEEELAALKAAKGPVTFAQRMASAASLIMSVFTLGTAISGVVLNIGRMGDILKEGTSVSRIQYVLQEHPIGVAVALLIVAIHIYFYFTKKKWEA
ncbi:MAG: hypothetical protein ABJP70_06520 [Erythrobacter sp.]